MRAPVDLPKSYRLLNHGPTVLVSSAHGAQRNVMAAAWSMPLDFDPPKVALVIDARTHTRALIEASGEFALSIPTRAIAAQVVAVGSHSGRTIDKFAALGLRTAPAAKVGAPLIEGCIGWLECRVLREPAIEQRHDLFIAEVVAAWADPRVFSHGRWHFDDSALRSIHHLAGGAFFETGAAFMAQDPIAQADKEAGESA